MRNKQIIYLILFLTLVLFSCKKKAEISDSKKINGDLWNIKQNVNLELDIVDISKFYNLYINIDVKEDFLTNNLWVFIRTKSPAGNIQSDTLMFYITDQKGKWLGKKNGEIIKNKFLYKSLIKFPKKGKYIFSISHGMREMDLPKVNLVGITIEEILK